MKYNKQQLEAIHTIDGSVQVVASAGSGKSTVLVERINYMIEQGINPNDIIALSFTLASANDLKKKLADKNIIGVTTGTMHSICKRLLEEIGYEDLLNMPKDYQLKRRWSKDNPKINIKDIRAWISYQKNWGIYPTDEFKEKDCEYSEKQMRYYYSDYQDYCHKHNLYDFDEWLLLTLKEYQAGNIGRTWKYLLNDEAQDNNVVQYQLMELMCPDNNIFIVGDYLQSIYSFRGANSELFYQFSDKADHVIYMNTNYRSNDTIVTASNDFIKPFVGDKVKYYAKANNCSKTKINISTYDTPLDEAESICERLSKLSEAELNNTAVLYRNNTMVDSLETLLKERNIPYTLYSSTSFFERQPIKGIMAVLRLVNRTSDDEALEQLLESRFYPTTYFKSSLVDDLRAEATMRGYSMYEALIDHKFDKAFEKDNLEKLTNIIIRLQSCQERQMQAGQIINRIVSSFRLNQWIDERYDSVSAEDNRDSIENLTSIAWRFNRIENFIRFTTMNQKKKKTHNGVSLMTIHRSKGLEFDRVYIIGCEPDRFPSWRDAPENEARLMYVAMTRAKHELNISNIQDEAWII